MKRALFLFAFVVLCSQAWAVPAYVQSTSNCSFGGTNNNTATVGGSSATTCPAATGWTSNVTAGNTLIAAVWRKPGSAALTSVGDGGDSCFVLNAGGTVGQDGAFVMYAGYCINIAGGTKPTITFTFANNEDTWFTVAHEVSGIATTAPLDGSAFRGQAFVGAGTNAATTGNWTTRANGDYIFCAFEDDGQNGRTLSSGTTSQAWTTRFGPDNTHTESMITEDGVQTTASTNTVCAFTVVGGGVGPLIMGIAFRASGVPAPPAQTAVLPKTSVLPKTTVF